MASRSSRGYSNSDSSFGYGFRLPYKDPSKNTGDLNEASNKRQDDLRGYSERLMDEKIRRINDIMDLRGEFQEKLDKAEAARIDAIRAVDVNAAAVANQRSMEQAQILANQVGQTAEALRGVVNSTAATLATSLREFQAALSVRVSTLEQGSYVQSGKQTLADPAMLALASQVDLLVKAQSQGTGKSEGLNLAFVILIAVVTAGLTIAGMLFTR